jgi:hypothetical protein
LTALSASIGALQEELLIIGNQITGVQTEISNLSAEVDTLQYNTTGITYLTTTTTTYIENNVKINATTNLDSSNISTTFIVPNNIERIISIGSATQSDTIILNGTVQFPLNSLFDGFRTSNGYLSQL